MSFARLALIVYTGALFFGTHCPLNSQRPADDSWLGTFLAGVVRFGHSALSHLLGPSDKLMHGVAYAVLTVLAFLAVASYRSGRERLASPLGWRATSVVLLVLMAYGLIDEATQPWFGRSFEWRDYLADLSGIGAATVLVVARCWMPAVSQDAGLPAEYPGPDSTA